MIETGRQTPANAARLLTRLLLILILGILVQSNAFAQSPPSTPNVKGFCCQGPLYGVFDLSGTWQGVNLHNPPVGTFLGNRFMYEGTELVGQSTFVINLDDQELFPPAPGGGQEVIQTYSGQFIETWYERPNNSPLICLASPQASVRMCEYVHKYATYSVTFSVRWCRAAAGWVFKGLVATEMELQFWDSGLSIPSRMVINPVEGDFCPTINVDSGAVTYDKAGDMIIAGFGPGGAVTFSTTAPNPYDEVEFRIGSRVDCWCEQGGTNLPNYAFARKLGPADVAALKGTLRFTVSSDLPLDLFDPPFRPLGQFNLLRQDGKVRSRGVSETDLEWQAYLDSIDHVFSFVDALPVYDAGEYEFLGLPLFEVLSIGGRNVIRPARYSLRFRGLNVEEYVAGSNPLVTQFTKFSGADAFNLQVGDLAPLVVTPLDGIPIKRNLIDELILMSPARYMGIEVQALAHLNTLDGGSPTPSQLEGLKRAILAERMARDGGRFGEQQITAMLTGLNNVLDFLIDDFFSKVGTGKKLKDKKKEISELNAELDAQNLINQGWLSLPETDAEVESAVRELIDSNFDLKVSELAKRLKTMWAYPLSLLKSAFIANGMDAESAELAATVISGVINTVFDVVIEQGPGALKTAAKEAIKQAVTDAQDDLFDTLSSSYTDRTDEALDYSRQQFQAWAVDDDAAFRVDRARAENELVQLGVDAYTTLGRANALAIVTGGFSSAESNLEHLEKIPLFKKAKALAKVGKYLTGAASFVIPLKGAFWDTPARVQSGVAKSYGQLPEDIFPPAASLPGEDKSGPQRAGLGNFVINPLKSTLLALESRIADLDSAWNSNSLDTVLDISTGSLPGDLRGLLEQAEKDMTDVLAMGAAMQGTSTTAAQMQHAFGRTALGLDPIAAQVLAQQLDLLMRILKGDYTGPTDARYLARRSEMLAGLDRLDRVSDGIRFALDIYKSTVVSLEFGSPVVANEIELTSQSTGMDLVTGANEIFDLSTSIRNLGGTAVTGVEVELSLPLASPVSILSAVVQVPGSGDLAANDGVKGSGTDEAIVSWQIQFTGPLNEQINSPLKLENRSTVAEDPGVYGNYHTVLTMSPEVFDADGDAMPSAWESDHGLNPAVDDGEDDADSDDLTNAEEYELQTDPQVMDSDFDGLDDGDETAGVNGWVTDPAVDDTDGDGVLDGVDGAPLDATTSDAVAGPEPIVAVSTNSVVLSEDQSQVVVSISNVGTGTLIWKAESGDTALVFAGSPDGSVQAGGMLSLQLVPGLDVSATQGETVQVRIRDVAGAIADEQIINVSIGELADDLFDDGFE